jgi:hypothetical protein
MAALNRQTIEYARIAGLLGQTVPSGKLKAALNEVADYRYAQWGIVLPALVLDRSDAMPAGRRNASDPGGFWLWCADNGFNVTDPRALLDELQRKVFRAVEVVHVSYHSDANGVLKHSA